MNATRLLVVCACLALLVAPVAAHPGHGAAPAAHDYALLLDESVPTAAVGPVGVGPTSAVAGVHVGEPVRAAVLIPADADPATLRAELRDGNGRLVATFAVADGGVTVPARFLRTPGVHVLALLDAEDVERDAVALVVPALAVDPVAVEDVADAGTPVAVQVTAYGAATDAATVTVVVVDPVAGVATSVAAERVRAGLYVADATLPLPVDPTAVGPVVDGPRGYRLSAVVADADGALLATSTSRFQVAVVDGERRVSVPAVRPDAPVTASERPAATATATASVARAVADDPLPAVGLAAAALAVAGVVIRRER